ncbi:MAG: tRNA pseudouridine55 synthase [Actinomycetota bacterium]|nr:tRNA pseudouridine55 synthase [Actinomycetota bacterium]
MAAHQPGIGFVLIDKPHGWTSHDVVAKVRRVLGTRRVGHAGTLDPMATGVLILGIGRATRLLGAAGAADKEYLATIRLGQSTTTDDAEGDVLTTTDATGLTGEVIAPALARFVGNISQRPSSVSAIKVDGRRSYDRIRQGEDVALPARPVTVHEFALLGRPAPAGNAVDVDVRVRCGTGTYVRALARDLGSTLGVGGHLVALRRTQSSGIPVKMCAAIDEFEVAPRVVPVAEVIRGWLPVVTGDAAAVRELSHGRRAPLATAAVAAAHQGESVAVLDPDGAAVAVARVDDGLLLPSVVLVDPQAVGSLTAPSRKAMEEGS